MSNAASRQGQQMSSTPKLEPAPSARERFPRSLRILGRQDFLRVQGEGRRVHTPNFVIMVLPGCEQRVGVTITRRVANAVGRNRVKRLVREVFRRNRDLFPARCELVVVARSGAQRLDYEAVRDEVSHARTALVRAANQAKSKDLAEPKP
jgi:ribonuclease P protein component